MADKTKKNDFVEIEFIAKDISNNQIFDTNILDQAKNLNPDIKETKPLIVSIGHGMTIPGFDKALEDKEQGKENIIKINSEQAYGKREPRLIKMVSKSAFKDHDTEPRQGMVFSIDNALAKVISVTGGRVLLDFNHPLAGKDLEYNFKIKKILSDNEADLKEKINSLQQFFFRQIFEFDIDSKRKKIIFKKPELTQILAVIRPKFKELLDYDIEIFAKSEKPSEKKPDTPKN